jgi:hypothetical protein
LLEIGLGHRLAQFAVDQEPARASTWVASF